ncbi:creatininase family protein [Thermoproteota archaeon]
MVKHLLVEMNWKEAEDAFGKYNMAILPGSNLHPYGLSCPLGYGIYSTQEIADRVGKRTGVVVLPMVQYGYVSHHGSFPGTIGVKSSTYTNYLKDICGWLNKWGVKKVLFIPGCGGNVAAVRQVADYIRTKWNMLGATCGSGPENQDWVKYKKNGGEGLTNQSSVMLYLRPDLVDVSRETYEGHKKTFGDKFELRDHSIVYFKGGRVNLHLRTKDITDTGGWGVPKDEVDYTTEASAVLGEAILKAQVDYMIDFIEEFKKIDIPPPYLYSKTGIDYPF